MGAADGTRSMSGIGRKGEGVHYARLRCHNDAKRQGVPHQIGDDGNALCGARCANQSQYWEDVEEPPAFEVCFRCWQAMKATQCE